MREKIQKIQEECTEFLIENTAELEQFRLKFLSKKGAVSALFEEYKTIAAEDRKVIGMLLNNLKKAAQEVFENKKEFFEKTSSKSQSSVMDVSMPAEMILTGSRHPISLVRNEMTEIFSRLGFVVAEGPEIEDDWHNFTALNFPPEHPARDMQDTFFIEKNPDIALRTHTSSVQIRMMEKNKPPLKIIMPGRVFRNEVVSARSHCIFHQVEGLYIDKNVSFADLKQTLLFFAREMFGEETQIRLRPSYFPFTEPSAEMDISCKNCGGKGCNICKYSGWLEILGCGMVDPNVLSNCGIDSNIYSGYAFGMGIERIAMQKFKVNDIRHYFENDVRFLKQFSHFS